jgi:hypothetical protein
MESKEKEILNTISSNKKKLDHSKKEYNNIQVACISELIKKLIKNITPIEYKIFSNKYIKLREIEQNDPLDKIRTKIEDNIQMYKIIIYLFLILKFERIVLF